MIKLVFLLLFFVFSNAFSDATYWVNKVNNPPTSYATIQQAIDAIPNNLSGQGVQTVQIDSGLYSESLLIDGFSNASTNNYIVFKPTPGHLHQGRHTKGVRVSGTSNPMVDIWTPYTRFQDMVFIQSGTATSSTLQARDAANGSLFERLIIVRNGNGFIFINNAPASVTLRTSVLISNFSGAGTFNCVAIDAGSTVDNITVWTDGDRNGSSGCANGVGIGGTSKITNSVVFGPGASFSYTSSNTNSNYNFSRDNTAPGANSLKNFGSDTLHLADTVNWNLMIGDSSKSILTDAGLDKSAEFSVDLDSTCFGTKYSIGAHDPNTETNCNAKTVTVDRPKEGKVFQRNGSNNCTKYIMSGTYEGTPDSIQWKAQGSWNKMRNVALGAFRDTVTVDTGAWTLYIRQKPDTTVYDSVLRTGCGENIGLFGESNVRLANPDTVTRVRSGTNAFVGGCDVGFLWKTPWGGYDSTANGTGRWQMRFADKLTDQLKVPVGIYDFAQYDCSMIMDHSSGPVLGKSDWEVGGRCFTAAMNVKRNCELDSIGSIMFYGGEADAYRTESEGYNLDTLFKSYIRNGLSWRDSLGTTAKITLNQIGPWHSMITYAGNENGLDTIRWGGIKLLESDTNIALGRLFVAGTTLYDMNVANNGGDSIHFGYSNTRLGRAELDTVSARMFRVWMGNYRGGENAHPPYIKAGQVLNSTTVELTTYVGAGKLKTKNGINKNAFVLVDSVGTITLDSVKIKTDTTLWVYTNRAIQDDTLTMSFASKNTGVGVDLTDSSSYGPDANMALEPCLNYKIKIGQKNTNSCFVANQASSGNRFFNWLRKIFRRR